MMIWLTMNVEWWCYSAF